MRDRLSTLHPEKKKKKKKKGGEYFQAITYNRKKAHFFYGRFSFLGTSFFILRALITIHKLWDGVEVNKMSQCVHFLLCFEGKIYLFLRLQDITVN